jgi:hypothetical protein
MSESNSTRRGGWFDSGVLHEWQQFLYIDNYTTDSLIGNLSRDKSSMYGICWQCRAVVRFRGEQESVCAVCGSEIPVFPDFEDLCMHLRSRDK